MEFKNFNEAYAHYREKLGPGEEFEWKGSKYSTTHEDDKTYIVDGEDIIVPAESLTNFQIAYPDAKEKEIKSEEELNTEAATNPNNASAEDVLNQKQFPSLNINDQGSTELTMGPLTEEASVQTEQEALDQLVTQTVAEDVLTNEIIDQTDNLDLFMQTNIQDHLLSKGEIEELNYNTTNEIITNNTAANQVSHMMFNPGDTQSLINLDLQSQAIKSSDSIKSQTQNVLDRPFGPDSPIDNKEKLQILAPFEETHKHLLDTLDESELLQLAASVEQHGRDGFFEFLKPNYTKEQDVKNTQRSIIQETAFQNYIKENNLEESFSELSEDDYIREKGLIVNNEDFKEFEKETSAALKEEMNNFSDLQIKLKKNEISKEEYDKSVKELKENSHLFNSFVNTVAKQRELVNIEKSVADMVDDNWHKNWLTIFNVGKKAKERKALSAEAEEHIETLQEDQKKKLVQLTQLSDGYDDFKSQMDDIETWFNNVEGRIKEITGGTYTTQDEIDEANAKLAVIKEEIKIKGADYDTYKQKALDYAEVIGKIHNDITEIGLNNEQLSAYCNVIGRNPGQILNLGNTLIGAAVDLGIGIVSAIDATYQVPEELINEMPESGIKHFLQAGLNYSSPIGFLFGDGAFGTKNEVTGLDESLWERFVKNQAEWRHENIDSRLRKPIQMDEIGGFADFAEWSSNLVAAQLPQLALMYATGGTSLYFLGASSMGSKYNQMQDAKELHYKTGGAYGMDHSFGSMYGNALFTGVTEALSEKVTLGAVNKTKGFIKGAGKEVLKKGYINYLTKQVFTPRNIAAVGYEMMEEGGTEVLATLGGNFADVVSGSRGWDEIYEGVPEAFVSGALISSTIQAPRLYKTLRAPFQSQNTNAVVTKNANRMHDINKELQDLNKNTDLSLEERNSKIDQLENEMLQLTEQTNAAIEQDVKRVDVLHDSEKKVLIEIERRNNRDQKSITNIKVDKKLTETERAKKIEELQSKINSRNGKKQQIIEKYPPNVVNENYDKKVNTLKQMAAMAEKMGGPKMNISEVNNDQFIDKTTRYDQDMSKSQVQEIANMNSDLVTSLNEIIADPNSTKQEIQDARDALADPTQQLNIADNLLNSKDYGVMQPKFDSKGNIESLDILINKDTALTDGMFNTAAHEFIHATFANTLKSDPMMRKILGGQLKTILEGKGVTFSSQSALDTFNKRIQGYDQDVRGEEMMAIASEMMMDGDIKFNNGVLQKLKNVFRRFAQNKLGYDIKFDKTEDIKNFMRDFHYSLENNKPSPAIARMLAKGANGKIFKDARTPAERKSEAMYNRNIEQITKKYPDWKPSFDQYTLNPDGTKKYKTKEDFQTSSDFWPAFQEISKSEGLKNLIASRGIYETGMNDKQEIKEFVDNVIQNVEDRFAGGPTKKARDAIKKIEEKRAKNELTPRETAEAIEKIENDPKSKKKGFDASAANGSLFGWLTSVAVPNSILVVKRKFIEEQGGRGRKMSIERQVGEGRTLKDLLPGVTDVAMERFESERILEKAKIDPQNLKVEDILNLPNNVKESILDVIESSDIQLDNLTYKDVKRLLNESNKVKSEKKVTPRGALFQVVNAVSSEFGVDPLRILAGQDLNAEQRRSAQKYIYDKSTNPDGSFNDVFLKILPEGQDRSGRATGVANTKLGDFYLKGERAKVKEGAKKELGQKALQNKRTDITKAEFLNMFGINENGTLQSGTKADGAIRELILQTSQLAANQSLRTHAIKTNSHPAKVIHRLGDGKSEAMYSGTASGNVPLYTDGDINITPEINTAINNVVNNYDSSDVTTRESLMDELVDLVKEVNPNAKKIVESTETLINKIEQLVFENLLQKEGKGYNSTIYNSEHTPQSLKNMFEVRGKTKQVVFKGPRLFDKQDNGYGKVNDAQVEYVNEVVDVLKNTHPDADMSILEASFGIKDSGSKIFNGEITWSTRSVNKKAHTKKFNELDNTNREINRKAEERLMKKHMTLSEIASLKDAQPMAMKGRVGKIIRSLLGEASLIRKLQMLGEFSAEISKINNGNKALMKYIAIKQMQARNSGKISATNTYHMGAMQTNIIEGTRALSTLKHIYLAEGQQWFGNKPGKNIKNYDSKLKDYYKNWKKHPSWSQALDIAKNYRSKSKPNGLKGQALLDKAINNLSSYNEHLAASSVTHAEKAAYIFSGGQAMSLDNLVEHHASFFGPKFLANELLDKKQVIKGKLVDNKISYEGDMRLTKFSEGHHDNIYHNNGTKVAEHIVQSEGLIPLINQINKKKPSAKVSNDIGRLQEKQNKSLKSKKIPKAKGMSTFDFDDTLASTKSGVRGRIPNTDGKPKPKRKVIFLAGGAGSGKSNVVNKLGLEGQGFKIVNQDISLEWLKKNSGLPTDMRDLTKEQRSTLGKLSHQARGIARRKMMKYQGNADGVVVDGTGASAKQMQKLVDEFKAKGYDTSMMFVETSLETSLKRNKARAERSLLDVIVRKNHEAVMGNKNGFQKLFGDRFMEVNTDKMNIDSPMPKDLVNKMNDFTTSYEKVRLDAEQFAEQGEDILNRGGEFDFSEFNEVVEGAPGPLLQKAINRAKKYGTKDLFILTARPQASAKAIRAFLKSQGLNIPLKNITGLADSSGNAKAQWMLDKFAEGYNDMYFVDDAMQNVDAVKHVLDQLDIKSSVVQAKLKDSNRLVQKDSDAMKSKVVEKKDSKTVDQEFNEMLERTTTESRGYDAVAADKKFSIAEGRVRGKVKGKWDYFIPPSAEDFKGLMYKLLGKGKQGDADLAWVKEKLLDPFAKGTRDWNAFKQRMVNEYKSLKKQLPNVVKQLRDLVPGTNFTNDNAIRVYLWNKNGIDTPGISNAMKRKLTDHVANNPDLKAYADGLGDISRAKDGYVTPSDNWMVETIGSDLNNAVSKDGRKQFLSEWLANKDVIFSKENMAKLEAIYGPHYVDALKDILYRMENGTNRTTGKDKNVNRLLDWINGSVGAVMFWNIRSAALQTISTVNFMNWGDNNIFKASAAFANIPQFAKDFAFIFNSDMLKQRRAGLQIDVNASELTNVFNESGSSPKKILQWLLEKGFTPTRIADSFAIAFGGASMYRNRLNKYIKEGMTEADAKKQAWLDFQEVAEETQQSSRPDLISQQQAGPLGRLILAWQNTPMQMTRLMKKALSDIANGRGDMKTNISKVIYYGAVQNIIFGSLQSGLAFLMFGDEEEEVIEDKQKRVINGALDTILRGTGIYGAAAATLKNTILQWDKQRKEGYGQQDWEKVIIEVMNFSPPIGSKLRKIMNSIRTNEYNKGVGEHLPWRVENPRLAIWANIIEATLNIPLARIVNKANNLEEAVTGNHELWQRIALISGWNRWDVGVIDEELEEAKIKAKEDRKEQKKIDKEIEKQKEQEEKEKQGIKTIRCSGTNSSGQRCGLTTETKEDTWKCPHHAEFKDGDDTDGDGIKEYRCTATKTNGQRCKNKTENENKKCYAHQ